MDNMQMQAQQSNMGVVVFDVHLQGSRYILTRMPADEHSVHGAGRTPTTNRLSPREWQIAGMIADGMANKTIARSLRISGATVSTHLRRIFFKLDVHSRAEMIARLSWVTK